MRTRIGLAATLLLVLVGAGSLPARAEEAVVSYRSLSPDVAFDLARAALQSCRKSGFQVAVVVLDRSGQPQVLLRDQYAGLPSATTATDKAYTALGFGKDTSELASSIEGGQLSAGLAKLPHVLFLAGGVTIQAGGSLIGAVGVAGAPGGDKDEACAKAGLQAVQDRIDF
jgi:uncharacterized protein GlcG (DUF336 family)